MLLKIILQKSGENLSSIWSKPNTEVHEQYTHWTITTTKHTVNEQYSKIEFWTSVDKYK